MNVVDWSALQITSQDLEAIVAQLSGIVHIRKLRQRIVRAILDTFPWDGRTDLVPVFDSSKSYQVGQKVALPHKEKTHSLTVQSWVVGEVISVETGKNPFQGQFDIVSIRVGKDLQSYAANVRDGHELPIAFPPKEDVDWDALVEEIERNSTSILDQRIEELVRNEQLAKWQNDVLPTRLLPVLTDSAKSAITAFFASPTDARNPDYRTDLEIANVLRERDEGWRDLDDALARFAINYYLDGSESYTHIGNGNWIASASQGVDTGANRPIRRRPDVPMIPSRIKPLNQRFLEGAPETPDQVAGTEELLAQVGEEEDGIESPEMSLEQWDQKTSRGPLDLPKLTFQHLVEGFIPLTKRLNAFFPPSAEPVLVHIKIVDDSDVLPFWVDRMQGVVKAHDPRAFFQKMQEREHPILPGVHLRIERMGRYEYRIAPIPTNSHQVSCKIARWSEDGQLDFTIEQITVNYHCDRTLFKAEYRHWDKPALFKEAEQVNASIFDLVYETLRDWKQEFQEDSASYLDLFNAVFLKRQCSPASVAALLYSYQCFVRDGDGWKLNPDPQSIRTKQYARRTRPERRAQPLRPSRRKAKPEQQIPAPTVAQLPVVPTPPTDSEFWTAIRQRQGHEFATLAQQRKFRIESVDDKKVVIRVYSTNNTREIPRKELEEAWNELKTRGELARTEIHDEISEANPAYIAAILASFENVIYESEPTIRLFYKQVAQQPTNETVEPAPERTRAEQYIAPGIVPLGPLFSERSVANVTQQYPKAVETLTEPREESVEQSTRDSREITQRVLERIKGLASVENLQMGRMPSAYIVDKKSVIILKYSRYHQERGVYFFGILRDYFWELYKSNRDLYFLAICGSAGRVLVIPGNILAQIGKGITNTDRLGYWKIYIHQTGGRYGLRLIGSEKPIYDCTAYLNNFVFLKHKSEMPVTLDSHVTTGEAYLLGLIMGKGEIHRSENKVSVTLQYGRYKFGQITGGGLALDEQVVLPQGALEVCKRIKTIESEDQSIQDVVMNSPSPYKHEIIITFKDQSGLLETIQSWYPKASRYDEFAFPTSKLRAASTAIARSFMKGYACATGIITDSTRAGPDGRHRVFIRASSSNREILNDVKWLLEQKLGVSVASIHWHEGRDPQLRVYAEDFEPIGFGIDWQDKLLQACAAENYRKFPRLSQVHPRLFD